ncbi:MAG TPA: hypothetical protein VGD58_05265 [Herpetosiphonaceae bacterium]
MSITTYDEDILPEIETLVPRDVAAYVAGNGLVDETPGAPAIVRDISGCVALIGPLQVCWDLNLSIPSAVISLKVGPVTVISGEISPAHPCLTFKGSYGVAKWDLNICLRIPQKSLTLSGSACATFVGCKMFNIVLFRWGRLLEDDELEGGELEGGDSGNGVGLGVSYPAYQCMKLYSGTTYCSSKKEKSHSDGNQWIKRCMARFNIRADDINNIFASDSVPRGAIQWG